MDRWESAIDGYQRSQTLDSFSSVLHMAGSILKEDLAPFELDWFIGTLLSQPVSLIDTVSRRLSDDAWSKLIKDAYKLLSELVENHHDGVCQYIDAIVMVCQKPQDARTRSHALQCLTACLKRSMSVVRASQYTVEVAQANTCKAPLALLVGTICEHHPETVTDQCNTIWRNYLNLLKSNKNTDLVCKSLLKGVWGLFKHFGTELPVTELNDFYDKLAGDYLRTCQDAVLPILRDYASLFKERLAADAPLRRELWTFGDLSAISPVYEQTGSVLNKDDLQKIFKTEIAPRTRESYAKLKFTALRVSVLLQRRFGVCVDSVLSVDVYSLEFALRRETSYDVAEAVSWSIESNMVNSEKLLQTCIMFYHNLPASRRKDIVVSGLLNSPADVMTTTLNFLVSESCQDESSLLTSLPLWRDVFDSQLIDKKQTLFEKYIENVLLVIENFLEDSGDDKKLPDKLASLLTLTSHVLTFQAVEDYTRDQCALVSSKLVELTRECGLEACIVAVARSATPHVGSDDAIMKIYAMIQIDKCQDEALLCEACLALTHAPSVTNCSVVLDALQVIFSRHDAEPKTLSRAIQKLQQLILTENKDYDRASLSKIIKLVEKLRSRKDMFGKDARILQRDVTIFLGKYYNVDGVNDVNNAEDNTMIVRLKDALTLDVPNPMEGTTHKIHLHRLLHLALTKEHEDSLRMCLNIICANLSTKNSPLLQVALGRVLVSLCRATVGSPQPNVARQAAAAFCNVDATLYIIQQIRDEKSPAVRRMLSDIVEAILLKDPMSEASQVLLKEVYKEVCIMMESNSSILKLGGLAVAESLLTALKVNTHQTKDMLPSLMILLSKTQEQDSITVFESASLLFMEKIGLFSASVLDSTISELLKIILNPEQEKANVAKAKIYRNTLKMTLNFARKVTEYCGEGSSKIIKKIFDIQANSDSVKFVYLWLEMAKTFELNEAEMKEIMDFKNSLVLQRVFDEKDLVDNGFALEAHLRFINQYAAVLFKFYSEATLKHISAIIEKLPPKYVRTHRTHLSDCLAHCRQVLQNTPDVLLKSFESWSESLPVKDITEHIEKEKFIQEHALSMDALSIMLEIFHLKDPTSILTTVSIFAKTWPKIILKIYAKGLLKYIKKEVPFLTYLLSVSLRFLTVTDVKSILLEGHALEGARNEKVGIEFCRFFMSVFVRYLVKKPYILLQDRMEPCCVLLNDVVRWCVRKRWHDDQLENVHELVDQLWPIYEPKVSFKLKHSLLLDLSCLNVKLRPDSRPMGWAKALISSNEAGRDDKIALVTVLPGGDEYSETYRRFASLLPTRLSDMDGASRAALRALLDALAGNGDDALLDIVITLADGDEAGGWWDEALASCMASLARLASLTRAHVVLARCRRASPVVCRRLLVPLLRYSSSSFCEQFFASILKETLEGLGGGIRPPSLHPQYRQCVQQKTINLDILQVLFEKVPASKIESPSSPLYEHIQTDKPWHVAREVIGLCHKLRDRLVAPPDAPPALAHDCREFQYSAYKCMCACVCVRRPDASIYKTVFNAHAWDNIVDETVLYELPLKTEWNQRKLRQSVSIDVTDGGRRARGSLRTRSLSRSRVFLRTLSENPLEYDLIDHQDDDSETLDVELTDNALNEHPCAGTLTALVQHVAELDHCEWRTALCDALTKSGRNVRWLLAGTVCNCREELKRHASALRPALLAVIADTALSTDTGLLLNSLHIDILNTLVMWREDHQNTADLNVAVKCLVHTALHYSARTRIFRMLEEVMENVLQAYGSIEGDLAVFERSFDDPNCTKACLKVLLRLAQHGVRVPGLLSWLLAKLAENYRIYRREISLLAETIGLLISKSNEREKSEAAERLKKILEDVRRSNVADYVKILYCGGGCDAQQLRTIVDLTQKLPESERKKCLRIISTYVCDHPDSPEVAELPVNIRQMADRISGGRQFEELFSKTPQLLTSSLSAKRAKLDVTSPILSTIGRNEGHIQEVLSRFGAERVARLTQKLCNDQMAVRFVECFYLAVYLPVKYPCDGKADLSVCMSAFFQMLFSHLKTQHSFKNKKLRDEPWILDHPLGTSRSRSRRMVGTLRSFSYTSNPYTNDDIESESGIDVQVSIEKILDTFVEFAKVTPEAAMELLIQLLRCVGRGFDSRAALAPLLATSLAAAPALVSVARECVDQLYMMDGFVQTVDELKKSTLGSEGEHVFRLLHEEIKMRRDGSALFVLGTPRTEDQDISMSEDEEFSIEGLVSAFQTLSNWDELTSQDKRRIELSLPALWTDRARFAQLLNQYTDTNGWFGQMVQLYRENRKDVMKWIRLMDAWPRRHYAVSAVIEGMQWHDLSDVEIDTLQMPCDIQTSDCLAEWAARLMLRTAYITGQSDTEATSKLSRSHELRWCVAANERGLHQSALSVINRNYPDLEEDETLEWIEQKLLASTAMAFKRNDRSELRKALDIAPLLPDHYRHSTAEAIIGVNNVIMQLNFKLDSLSSSKIDDIVQVVATQVDRLNERGVTSFKNKKNLTDMYETAVLYYDGLWNGNELSNDDNLVKMCAHVDRLSALGAQCARAAAVVLNRLDESAAISDDTATALLATMKPLIGDLPSCYLDLLRDKLHLFPARILRSSGITQLQGEPALLEYKQRLQLLCLADYLLLQYCNELSALTTDDPAKFDEVFTRMRGRIFENKFKGTDYEALDNYKTPLDNIRTADPEMKRIVLKGIMQDLKSKPIRETIRLSHVCPSLVKLDPQCGLGRLLRLPAGVEVVKIEEELRVFTDSVRRPSVLSVLTSDGKRRRYLHKNEDLRADASVRNLSAGSGYTLRVFTDSVRRPSVLSVLTSDGKRRRYLHKNEDLRADASVRNLSAGSGYTVIPLSEDCGLIEFLEDQSRIRELIESTCDIDAVPIVRQAVEDKELVLAPKTSSIQNYNEICSRIPAYSLRSAIEGQSASAQDFISKRRRFMETLSDVTISTWLFGLGDRHLQNLLYSIQDGGVQCIDWGAIFTYGGAELPPARLTRNMLAVCDTAVLESKLQSKLSSLRESHRLTLSVIKLSFRWMKHFSEKLVYMQGILGGTMLPHQITRDVLSRSDERHKMKYIQLLDELFSDRAEKQGYSVQEQVSCLLRQSTEPWILSVTRTGWEPWL